MQQEDKFASQLTTDICNCIDDLKQEYHLPITVHLLGAAILPCWYRFLPYNTHQCIYCLCIKDSSEAWEHCIACQGRVLRRAAQDGPYMGVCWAGRQEAIFPLCRADGTPLAFLSAGGYAAPKDMALPRIQRAAREFSLNYSKLLEAYNTLDPAPDFAQLNRRTAPLRHMITLLIEHFSEISQGNVGCGKSSQQYQSIIVYINRYFADKITIQSLADTYHCSYSYISHLFKQFSQESFTAVLAHARVDAAKKYLEYTAQSIMEIASSVGFDDPNYFSNVFRRETGVSPTVYRQRHKSIHNTEKRKQE